MSDKLNKKRERGANYTPEEKSLLIDLIMRYKTIIEDKSTGGHIINKKKEAWREIALQYNSNSVTGTRQIDQLKALYDNMKQKTRKNVGEKNKLEYVRSQMSQLRSQENNIQGEDFNVTQSDIAIVLGNLKEDKAQMHKTGGGVYKPKVTDCDAKLLSIIQEQVEPHSNPFDSGAEYFKDIDLSKLSVQVDMHTSLPSTSFNEKHTYSQEINSTDKDQHIPNDKSAEKPSRLIMPNERKVKNVAVHKKKVKKPTSTEALKRNYFKKKCQNANMERKNLMNEILYKRQKHNWERQEHDLRMILLKQQLDNLNKC